MENKNITLSYSKVSTYLKCSKKYYYQYIKKIRTSTLRSNLLFGSAVGTSLQQICLKKKVSLTDKEKEIVDIDPYEYFDQLFSEILVDSKIEFAPICKRIRYSKSVDYNPNLLSEEDLDLFYMTFGYYPDTRKLPKAVKLYPNLNDDDYIKINFMFWLMIRKKGHYIINQFMSSSYNLIEKVYDIEKKVESTNDEGDSLIGYIDLIADVKFPDGNTYKTIIDFKTSKGLYEESRIETSQQLALYSSIEGIPHVSYFVFDKHLKKLYDKINEQVLFAKLDLSHTEALFNDIQFVLENVKNEVFEQNRDACYDFGKCEYYDLCYGNITEEEFLKQREKKVNENK